MLDDISASNDLHADGAARVADTELADEENTIAPDDLADLEEVVKGRRRWLGRSGVTVGAAASLAVGALLGGIFEGIPILLPHSSAARGGSLVAPSGGAVPWRLADAMVVSSPTETRSGPTPKQTAQTGAPANPQNALGARPGQVTSATPTSSGPSPVGSGPSAPVTGGPAQGGSPLTPPAPTQTSCAICGVLNPIVGPSGPASSLPLVGGVLSTTTQVVGGAVSTVTGGLGSTSTSGSTSLPLGGTSTSGTSTSGTSTSGTSTSGTLGSLTSGTTNLLGSVSGGTLGSVTSGG